MINLRKSVCYDCSSNSLHQAETSTLCQHVEVSVFVGCLADASVWIEDSGAGGLLHREGDRLNKIIQIEEQYYSGSGRNQVALANQREDSIR